MHIIQGRVTLLQFSEIWQGLTRIEMAGWRRVGARGQAVEKVSGTPFGFIIESAAVTLIHPFGFLAESDLISFNRLVSLPKDHHLEPFYLGSYK